jgi:hypothetical protein
LLVLELKLIEKGLQIGGGSEVLLSMRRKLEAKRRMLCANAEVASERRLSKNCEMQPTDEDVPLRTISLKAHVLHQTAIPLSDGR